MSHDFEVAMGRIPASPEERDAATRRCLEGGNPNELAELAAQSLAETGVPEPDADWMVMLVREVDPNDGGEEGDE